MIRKALIIDNYRYHLFREWNTIGLGKTIFWVMLNPSIADTQKDDPTIRRIINFSKQFGAGRLWVGNLYAYVTTNSSNLFQDKKIDYIGYLNDFNLLQMKRKSDMTILACGNVYYLERLKQVHEMLKPVYTLKITKKGFPAHPLYLKKDLKPILYEMEKYLF